LAQNRSQNQAFEGSCLKHPSRLLDRPIPDFLALSVGCRGAVPPSRRVAVRGFDPLILFKSGYPEGLRAKSRHHFGQINNASEILL
jgi:hypothetical protein